MLGLKLIKVEPEPSDGLVAPADMDLGRIYVIVKWGNACCIGNLVHRDDDALYNLSSIDKNAVWDDPDQYTESAYAVRPLKPGEECVLGERGGLILKTPDPAPYPGCVTPSEMKPGELRLFAPGTRFTLEVTE